MLGSLLILLAMPLLDTSRIRGSQFRPLMRLAFWAFVTDFFLLMYLGSQHAEEPYITVGAIATAFYFGWFVVVVPVVGIIENTLSDIATDPEVRAASSHNPLSALRVFSNSRRAYSTSSRLPQTNPLVECRLAIQLAIQNFANTNSPGTSLEFQQVANGFFQAEGSVTAVFRGLLGLQLYPVMSMVQLYSPESVTFFVRLYYALGCVGHLNVHLNDSNKPMITYRLVGWNQFFNVFRPYFTMLFGLKYLAILKLVRIHEIVQLVARSDQAVLLLNVLRLELVELVYSLSPVSASRRLHSLIEKLLANNIPNVIPTVPFSVPENTYIPTFLWILGFFLGDGSLFISLKWVKATSMIRYVPTLSIFQKALPSNVHLINIISSVLTAMGIKNRLESYTSLVAGRTSTISVLINTLEQCWVH